MAESDSTERFLELLEIATRETGVSIGGCGCCGSPGTEDAALEDVTYQGVTYVGRYTSDDEKANVAWESAYEQCLDVHRKEWKELQTHLWQEVGVKRYGRMNTEAFGRLVLSGEVGTDRSE